MTTTPTPEQQPEELDIQSIIDSLTHTIAGQALEIAKAQAMIRNRDLTIAAQTLVIEHFEDRYQEGTTNVSPA